MQHSYHSKVRTLDPGKDNNYEDNNNNNNNNNHLKLIQHTTYLENMISSNYRKQPYRAERIQPNLKSNNAKVR